MSATAVRVPHKTNRKGAGLGLVAWLGLARVESRLATIWQGEALRQSRLPLWADSWPLVAEFPLLGTGYGFVPMSSLTAGWVLSGASSQWKNAKPGKVFETMLNGDYANPVMVVDEIDKAGGDAQYDPLGALYSLLEHDTAGSFIDEFAEVPIDASQVIWVATANDEHAIPEPILNRMNVYAIDAPDEEGARRIAAGAIGITSFGDFATYTVLGWVYKTGVEVVMLPVTYRVIAYLKRHEPTYTAMV